MGGGSGVSDGLVRVAMAVQTVITAIASTTTAIVQKANNTILCYWSNDGLDLNQRLLQPEML